MDGKWLAPNVTGTRHLIGHVSFTALFGDDKGDEDEDEDGDEDDDDDGEDGSSYTESQRSGSRRSSLSRKHSSTPLIGQPSALVKLGDMVGGIFRKPQPESSSYDRVRQ